MAQSGAGGLGQAWSPSTSGGWCCLWLRAGRGWGEPWPVPPGCEAARGSWGGRGGGPAACCALATGLGALCRPLGALLAGCSAPVPRPPPGHSPSRSRPRAARRLPWAPSRSEREGRRCHCPALREPGTSGSPHWLTGGLARLSRGPRHWLPKAGKARRPSGPRGPC